MDFRNVEIARINGIIIASHGFPLVVKQEEDEKIRIRHGRVSSENGTIAEMGFRPLAKEAVVRPPNRLLPVKLEMMVRAPIRKSRIDGEANGEDNFAGIGEAYRNSDEFLSKSLHGRPSIVAKSSER
ncbi:hypothetical protein ACLOJK_001370 [Asimina triloba]